MRPKKPLRRVLRSLCAEVHPDDGVDPRERERQRASNSKSGRKARQLGRQVAETLEGALACQADACLRGLRIVSVAPAPDASRLLVTVAPIPGCPFNDPAEVLERLERGSGRLRSEVAAAITRKRAPLLVYRLALPSGEEKSDALAIRND